MEEPELIQFPRLGGHISMWGSGHSCAGTHEGPCRCECGAVQPYDEPEEAGDANPQDREGRRRG